MSGTIAVFMRFAFLALLLLPPFVAGCARSERAAPEGRAPARVTVEDVLTAAPDLSNVRGRLWTLTHQSVPALLGGPRTRHSIELRAVVARADAQAARGNVEDLRIAGVAHLVAGEIDEAVKRLERAAELAPGDPAVVSDLGAAYMSRAEQGRRADDWPRALGAAERAARLAPRSPVPAYNLARTLQSLHLVEQARRYWRAYFEHRDDPGWQQLARVQMGALPRTAQRDEFDSLRSAYESAPADRMLAARLVAHDGQRTREYFEDVLLPSLVEAATAADGRERIQKVSDIAEALAERGDALPVSALAAWNAAGPPARQALRAGFAAWREGRQAHAAFQMTDMTTHFRRAASFFRQARSPLEFWARHYVVVGLYYQGAVGEAQRQCALLLDVAEHRGYRALLARLQWDMGTLQYQQGFFERALRWYERASQLFVGLNERDNVLGMHQLKAEAFGRLGDPTSGWTELRSALRELAKAPHSPRRHLVLASCGYAALNLQMPEAAFHLFDVALRDADDSSDVTRMVEALNSRARALIAMQFHAQARSDLDAARPLIARISDPSIRLRAEAQHSWSLAEAWLVDNPRVALVGARAALKTGDVAGLQFRRARLHLLAARAARSLGDDSLAREHLESGISALETSRASIERRGLRVSFMDSVWDLYGERVALAVATESPGQALEWLERSRSRLLTDDIVGTERVSFSVARLQRRLGAEQAAIYYHTREEVVWAWLVTRERVRFFETRVPVRDVTLAVREVRSALERQDAPTSERLLRDLGRWLLDAVELSPAISVVAICPDATLEPIPFHALKLRDGRFLTQAVATVLVPSGAVLLRSTPPGVESRKVSVIAATAPDAESIAAMPVLVAAAAEARDVATLYPSAALLTGKAATVPAFVSALTASDVLHFAGHAAADADEPWRARLFLAAGSSESGVLSMERLVGVRSRARLVVLAACETGLGHPSRAEGLLSLGRPLLAAGVRNVVVGKWRVDDRAARPLVRLLHMRVGARAISPVVALRQAQLTMLERRETSAPHAWAMLEIHGQID